MSTLSNMLTSDVTVDGIALSAEAIERFWSHVSREGDGCWNWTGRMRNHGYGCLGVGNRSVVAHRASWVIAGLDLKTDFEYVLDHVCRNRRCVNPDHLRQITRIENVMIGIGPTAINARKVKCVHGHDLTAENVREYVGANGKVHRECRPCANERRSRRKQCPECGGEFSSRTFARHVLTHKTTQCKGRTPTGRCQRVVAGDVLYCHLHIRDLAAVEGGGDDA